jgi:hypothetical protein
VCAKVRPIVSAARTTATIPAVRALPRNGFTSGPAAGLRASRTCYVPG